MSPIKKRNIPAMVIKGIFIGIVAIAIGFGAGYMISDEKISERNNRQECSLERTKAFKGVVRSVHLYEWDEHMNEEYFGLSIKVSDTSSLNYMFAKEDNTDLAKFVELNDSIIKTPGTDSFTVVKDDGLARHFVVPVCGED